jgi:tetratricopeptide (TPR) repeat protein
VADDLVAALDRTFDDELAALQVQLAGALEEFWYLRGAYTEARARAEAVLARGAGFRSHRAEVHRAVGNLAQWQGDFAAATHHLEQAHALFAEIVEELRAVDGSPHLAIFEQHLALTLLRLSEVALAQGEADAAAKLATEALALCDVTAGVAALHLGLAEQRLGAHIAAQEHFDFALRTAEERDDALLAGDCFRNLGVIARAAGDLSAAEVHYRRALAVDRGSSAEQILARSLLSLAELMTFAGTSADDLLDEGLALARALGDRQAEALGVATLAERTASDDIAAAALLHKEAHALRSAVGAPAELALSQIRIAAFAEFEGRLDEAAGTTERAASTFRRLVDHRGTTEALAQLARIHARRGDAVASAVALAGALDSGARGPTVLERPDVLDAAAWLAASRDRRPEARGLLELADAYRERIGIRPAEPTARLRAALSAELAGTPPADLTEAELLSAAAAV